MQSIYHIRTNCRLCGSDKLETVVPLEPMPIATPNFAVPGVDRDHPVFKEAVPLELDLCKKCGMLQVSYIGNPEIQYTNYLYTTSISLGLRNHFAQYAQDIMSNIKPRQDALVVEMGSNDGTLLGFFKKQGLAVQGVDPARHIAEQATEYGIPTRAAFFTEAEAKEILEERGEAGIVIANNVYANIDDLTDIMKGVAALLAGDGVFVMETQYGPDVVEHNLLDTVYHEHLSYFALTPLLPFYARYGLEVIHVQHINTKGGSFRVTAQLIGGPRLIDGSVGCMRSEEIEKGIQKQSYYTQLTEAIKSVKSDLQAIITTTHKSGKKVAGYGVSVGTTTLLPQFAVTQDIDFLIDDDPTKDSILSGPDYDIPIFQSEHLKFEQVGVAIIFAWRYSEAIICKNKDFLEQGGAFVIPLPNVVVIKTIDDLEQWKKQVLI